MKTNHKVTSYINSETLFDATNVLQNYFNSSINIKKVHFLRRSGHLNILIRLFLASTFNVPKSVILKQFSSEQALNDQYQFTRFARDWATLKFLNDIPPEVHYVPNIFGVSQKHRFILIEDLGKKHISLVDELTMPYKDRAISVLLEFMQTMGKFHARNFGKLDYYNSILKQIIYPEIIDYWESELNHKINNLLLKLRSAHIHFGYPIKDAVIYESTIAIKALFSPGPFLTLIHGDVCPDNIFINKKTNKLHLIDFESSFPGNALIDATCLRMAMPTCWCSKAIPDDIIEFLENSYRIELQKTIPAAMEDNTYHQAYTNACAFWLLNAMMFLESILNKELVLPSGPVPNGSFWKRKENLCRPRFITRLIAFTKVSEKYGFLPNLREMAINMLTTVKSIWPEAKPLELYHPFQIN